MTGVSAQLSNIACSAAQQKQLWPGHKYAAPLHLLFGSVERGK